MALDGLKVCFAAASGYGLDVEVLVELVLGSGGEVGGDGATHALVPDVAGKKAASGVEWDEDVVASAQASRAAFVAEAWLHECLRKDVAVSERKFKVEAPELAADEAADDGEDDAGSEVSVGLADEDGPPITTATATGGAGDGGDWPPDCEPFEGIVLIQGEKMTIGDMASVAGVAVSKNGFYQVCARAWAYVCVCVCVCVRAWACAWACLSERVSAHRELTPH